MNHHRIDWPKAIVLLVMVLFALGCWVALGLAAAGAIF